jgi:hypothetical protein
MVMKLWLVWYRGRFRKFAFGADKSEDKVVFFVADPSPGTLYWCGLSKRTQSKDKSLPIGNITDIFVGKQTAAFDGKKGQSGDDTRCFSIKVLSFIF